MGHCSSGEGGLNHEVTKGTTERQASIAEDTDRTPRRGPSAVALRFRGRVPRPPGAVIDLSCPSWLRVQPPPETQSHPGIRNFFLDTLQARGMFSDPRRRETVRSILS